MPRPLGFKETEFLDKMMDLFWKKGYHNVSTQDMLEYANLSRSSMYNTFRDKRTVFVRSFARYQELQLATFENLANEFESAKKAFEAILQFATNKSLTDSESRGCFQVSTATELAAHDEEIAEMINEHRRKMVSIFSSIVQRGIDSGELSSELDPDMIGNFIMTVVNGAHVEAKSVKDIKVYDAIYQGALAILQT